MPTRVYIDGFNLYYGLIRKNRLHWLDLEALSERLNLGQPVDRIIYCTAMVSSTADDPDKPMRQNVYHQALRAGCPNLEILLGTFTKHQKLQAISGCKNAPTCAVSVIDRNEKGSDVNLASHLLHDAHLGKFDRAIVISGDSDLVEPIRLVVSEVKKPVWVRNPYARESAELKAVASHYSALRAITLKKSQFPDPLQEGNKTIRKPFAWTVAPKPASKTEIFKGACPQAGCANQIKTCRWE